MTVALTAVTEGNWRTASSSTRLVFFISMFLFFTFLQIDFPKKEKSRTQKFGPQAPKF